VHNSNAKFWIMQTPAQIYIKVWISHINHLFIPSMKCLFYEIILVPVTKQNVKRGIVIVIDDLQHYNKDPCKKKKLYNKDNSRTLVHKDKKCKILIKLHNPQQNITRINATI
jgi:hypothetical protein